MTRTLKRRISFIYSCLVIMMALIGLLAVWNLFRLSNSINNLMIANYKSIKVTHQMIQAVEQEDYAILTMFKMDEKEGIRLFFENHGHFKNDLYVEEHNITEPGELELVKELSRNYNRFIQAFSRVRQLKKESGDKTALAFYHSQMKPTIEKTKRIIEAITLLNERAMFRSKHLATRKARASMYLILTLSLWAVFGGFFTAYYWVNRFFAPINQLTETVRLVKAGDLDRQAPIVYQDEIGILAGEFNNLTRRLKQFEESTLGHLMAEKNKSLAIVKSISDPLIVLDRDYSVQLMNPAAENLFSLYEAETVGKHFMEVIRHDDLRVLIDGIRESPVEQVEQIISFETNGEHLYFNVVAAAVIGHDAERSGLVILFQNVTGLKLLEKMKTDFLATISHEFKTPLTSIMMGASLLHEHSVGELNEHQLQIVHAISEDGERLTALVNNLLELSKIESGQSIFKMLPTSIIGIIERTIKPILDQARNKSVHLTFEAADDLPNVKADSEKIGWVINNLITNALKYTNAGDEILISAAAKHGKMFVTVRDTGIGIPQEYIDKIFNRYVQLSELDQDREIRGTGLGLAIVKEIVEAHGGEIGCVSKLDVGSTFTFTLPLA